MVQLGQCYKPSPKFAARNNTTVFSCSCADPLGLCSEGQVCPTRHQLRLLLSPGPLHGASDQSHVQPGPPAAWEKVDAQTLLRTGHETLRGVLPLQSVGRTTVRPVQCRVGREQARGIQWHHICAQHSTRRHSVFLSVYRWDPLWASAGIPGGPPCLCLPGKLAHAETGHLVCARQDGRVPAVPLGHWRPRNNCLQPTPHTLEKAAPGSKFCQSMDSPKDVQSVGTTILVQAVWTTPALTPGRCAQVTLLRCAP